MATTSRPSQMKASSLTDVKSLFTGQYALAMSIYFSGTFKRSAGLISAIQKQLQLVNLKPVKKVEVSFDPFHPQANVARDFMYFFSSKRVINTNTNCIFKTNIVCDRSDPKIKINLSDSSIINYEAANLTVLEILQHFNKQISVTVDQKTVHFDLNKDKPKAKRTRQRKTA